MKILAALSALAALPHFARADWQPDPASVHEQRVAAAIAEFAAKVPQRYFAETFGYAVFPRVRRAGYGLGGAWGRGMAFEAGIPVGDAGFWQVTSGIQAGARTLAMIVFFKDESAMRAYKDGRLQFMGQAGFAAASLGSMKTPAYNSGVAIFALDGFGLMGEASIAMGKLSFSGNAD